MMEIIQEEKQGIILLHISGNMVADTIGSLKKVFENCLETNKKKIILNLNEVEIIDSFGVAAIVFMVRKCHPEGDIKIARAKGQVARIFYLLKLDKIIEVYSSVNGSISAFE